MEDIKPIEGRAVYAPPSRPSTEPATTGSAPESAKDVSPQFVSPKGNVDPKSGVFVTVVRDTGTGKVSFQYPSKTAVAAYANSRQTEQAQKAPEQSSANEGSKAESSQVESSEKAKSSAVADAITDGTKGQE